MKRVKDAFDERAAALDGLLGVGRSFDMIGRTLRIGGRREIGRASCRERV